MKERVVLDDISLPDDFLVGRGIPYKEVSLPDLGGIFIKLDYAFVLPEMLSRSPMSIAISSLCELLELTMNSFGNVTSIFRRCPGGRVRVPQSEIGAGALVASRLRASLIAPSSRL